MRKLKRGANVKKKDPEIKKKVWAIIDENNRMVGAHEGKKYIAELNAFFSDDGKVVQATITYKLPKRKKKNK